MRQQYVLRGTLARCCGAACGSGIQKFELLARRLLAGISRQRLTWTTKSAYLSFVLWYALLNVTVGALWLQFRRSCDVQLKKQDSFGKTGKSVATGYRGKPAKKSKRLQAKKPAFNGEVSEPAPVPCSPVHCRQHQRVYDAVVCDLCDWMRLMCVLTLFASKFARDAC